MDPTSRDNTGGVTKGGVVSIVNPLDVVSECSPVNNKRYCKGIHVYCKSELKEFMFEQRKKCYIR